MRVGILLSLFLFCALPAGAEEPGRMCSSTRWGHAQCIRPAHFVYDTCNAIRTFADRHGLNRDFFARLIWQESRFDANALSPANARGIAQFIPSTAARRGLADPYNPADALEHSAQYLAEMVARYGNEGLAAVGYNGGEGRAEGFLEGKDLARETVNYVPIITGLPAEVWRDDPPQDHDMRLSEEESFLPACYALARDRRITPLAPLVPAIMPWGVQVAVSTSQSRALSEARRRTRSCDAVVGGEKPQLIYKKNRRAGKPGYYFAQLGRLERAPAQRLCTQMRAAGCICLVVKN
ncbi:MAG: lytic transglycosylase domain-containing protein [Sulfitobacter sp.]|nr:lytic transglycosylase domain-containing protein [Sulfitobacter sp.]